MKLSIIIPVYNTEKYLEDCVSSLFDQHIPQGDFEIILINDGSTDGSLQICNQLSEKHENICVIDQENKGQSVARNVGLKQAKGKYIYFIDSDDYLNSGYLGDFLKIIDDNNLDFLGFQLYHTSERYTPYIKTEVLKIEVEGDGMNIIDNHNYYNGSCWFIFEKAIAENLSFEEGRVCEDVIFTTELLLKVKKGRVYKNRIYGYFTNNDSTIKTKNPERLRKINNDMFYTSERLGEIICKANFEKNPKAFSRLKARQESYVYFAIVRFIRSKRKYSELATILLNLEKGRFPAYPIHNFKGYNKRDKLLIKCFNNRLLLQTIININHILGLIK
ncbi:glycosyltransferase family 2 protein [Capnocytophaga felis]|uniref:Glycosyl transferase n=1 Tax=Capnocytophaga felis TaxID=2267611 RepID=A0A5M4B751_9FLAO|nr:glycosyltransferase [Capnocytophaga felis]GET45348.1 glycosyl transferase [Capnocytophaga felis]GET47489.1 glycosyl transferase [Capnocytophaga felis]